jgi:iron(III) transport system substrate-binding protein
MTRSLHRLALAGLVGLLLGACGPAAQSPAPTIQVSAPPSPTAAATAGGTITVYSGRSEELVGELLERFESETGITVQARYGDTAELAVLLTEEGANSPADVYFAQDGGALGSVAQAGLLAELPDSLLERVPAAFRSPAGLWVGISGRARVVAYDSASLGTNDLPTTIDDLTDEQWRGRIGWAPTNGSFQAFVTALRLMRGDEGARAWLEEMLANEPVRYDGNSQIVQAIADGEVDLGLVNHYYALRQIAEQGQEFPVRNHFFAADDPGSLINVAGAAMLASSDSQPAALRLIEWLLSQEAQSYFAERTFEYPLVEGVEEPQEVPPLADLQHPDIDLTDLADLQGTLELLREVGVLE